MKMKAGRNKREVVLSHMPAQRATIAGTQEEVFVIPQRRHIIDAMGLRYPCVPGFEKLLGRSMTEGEVADVEVLVIDRRSPRLVMKAACVIDKLVKEVCGADESVDATATASHATSGVDE